MTGRPDYADHGGEAARMSSHRRCVCGDADCSPPSSGWRARTLRPLIQLGLCYLQMLSNKLDNVKKEVHAMAEATAAALAELNKDLHRLADGWAALKAENDALKAALADADAVKAQAVADAIAADDAVDSAAIADADAIVEGLSPEPAPEPAPEEPPVEG